MTRPVTEVVLADNQYGAAWPWQHFVEQGHRRIAILAARST